RPGRVPRRATAIASWGCTDRRDATGGTARPQAGRGGCALRGRRRHTRRGCRRPPPPDWCSHRLPPGAPGGSAPWGPGSAPARPDLDEEALSAGLAPEASALAVAAAKAAAPAAGDAVVLAADTIVVLDGAVFGKPRSDDGARRMLASLRGRDHEVITAVV